jgi:hypothetical protein
MATQIYPVVHHIENALSMKQVDEALGRGADGVYLIDHHSSSPLDLLRFYVESRKRHLGEFIGINFLQLDSGLKSYDYLKRLDHSDVPYPDAIWQDNARRNAGHLAVLRRYATPQLKAIKYGAGIAFKYTEDYTDRPDEAAAQARELAPFVDVVVTSGPGTNQSANPDKIAAMKTAIGDQRLAIASGISLENFELYRPHIDEVFVSSSIETKPGSGVFDLPKLQDIIDIAHQV